MKNWQAWIRRSLLALAMLAAIYAGAFVWAGREAWGVAATSGELHKVSFILGLVVLGLSLRVCRWQFFVCHLQWRLPVRHSVMAFLSSLALTATPGKSGELVKAALLKSRYQIPVTQTAAVLVVERVCDFAAIAVIAASATSAHAELPVNLFAILLLAALGLVVFTRRPVYRSILGRTPDFWKLRSISTTFVELLDKARDLLALPTFIGGLAFALAAWSCEAFALHITINAFAAASDIRTSFSIFGLSTLAGVATMVGGGVGGFEAAMMYLLAQLGATLPTGAMTVALFRICTLWFCTLVGVCCLLCWISFVARTKDTRPEVPDPSGQ